MIISKCKRSPYTIRSKHLLILLGLTSVLVLFPITLLYAQTGEVKIIIGDPNYGKALFIGEARFVNGATPCVACHSVASAGIAGGTLSVDLSDVANRYGVDGLTSVLTAMPFPLMDKIYAGDKKLTEEEVLSLVAFLDYAAKQKAEAKTIYPFSALGFFAVIILLAVIYYMRVSK